MILEVATGRPVYNLDLGMCGADDGAAQLYQAAQTADVILVEGVMGLYDGAPSSADLALQFDLPVLVTIDASAMAQTFSAIAAGLLSYNLALKPAGVIANKLGSVGHGKLLQEALPKHLSWFGALLKEDAFTLPERHLGLHRAAEIKDLEAKIEAAAKALRDSSDLPLPPLVTFNPPAQAALPQLLAGRTIAIARDAAFCFIYPANVDCLQAMGATLIYFSPIADNNLPEAHGYWLPGGYPELHLADLKQNTRMKAGLKAALEAGKPILAECGGMMALGETLNGEAAFGLLAGHSTIEPKLQGLGTQTLATAHGTLAAHTFHYGKFETSLSVAHQATSQYGSGEAVYRQRGITASFLHFYFPSNPAASAAIFLAK